MLIDEPAILGPQDPFLAALSRLTVGTSTRPARLKQGIYRIGHFNGNYMLPRGAYDEWPNLPPAQDGEWRNSYGVCDSVANLLDKLGDVLNDPQRQFVVTLTSVRREHCPEDGGWRWHKWGPYIGAQNPQHEYLYDETHIDEVFCYHVYEKKPC